MIITIISGNGQQTQAEERVSGNSVAACDIFAASVAVTLRNLLQLSKLRHHRVAGLCSNCSQQ